MSNEIQPDQAKLLTQQITNGKSASAPPFANQIQSQPSILKTDKSEPMQTDQQIASTFDEGGDGEDLISQLHLINSQIETITSCFTKIISLLFGYFDDIERAFLESVVNKEGIVDLATFNKKEQFLLTNRTKLTKYQEFVNAQYSQYIQKSTKLSLLASNKNQSRLDALRILQNTGPETNIKDTMYSIRLINKTLTQTRTLQTQIIDINGAINQFSSFNTNLVNGTIYYPITDAPPTISISNLLTTSASMFSNAQANSVSALRDKATSMINSSQVKMQKRRLKNQILLPNLNSPSSNVPTELISKITALNNSDTVTVTEKETTTAKKSTKPKSSDVPPTTANTVEAVVPPASTAAVVRTSSNSSNSNQPPLKKTKTTNVEKPAAQSPPITAEHLRTSLPDEDIVMLPQSTPASSSIPSSTESTIGSNSSYSASSSSTNNTINVNDNAIPEFGGATEDGSVTLNPSPANSLSPPDSNSKRNFNFDQVPPQQ